MSDLDEPSASEPEPGKEHSTNASSWQGECLAWLRKTISDIGQRSFARLRKTISDVGPGLFIILAVEIVVFRFLSPYFFTVSNFLSIGRRMVTTGIMAAGETIVIIAGGFDLSVGSVAAAAGTGAAYVLENTGAGMPGGVATALAIGLLVGLVNGAVTGYGRINPLITTLGTLAIVRGIAFLMTNNRQIDVKNPIFKQLGRGFTRENWDFVIYYDVLFLIGVFLVFGFIIPRYRFGRYMYAIGSNERAASLAGVQVNRWKLVFFGVCGMLAGFAGLVNSFKLVTAAPSYNQGDELEVITAVILGGASLLGGRGRLLGTFLGLLFLAILLNGLVISGVDSFYQRIATGSALILAVLFDEWRRSRISRH